MPADTYFVETDAQVRAINRAFLAFVEKCRSFAEEVAESETDCGAMSIIDINRHIEFLRKTERNLKGAVQ
jgi:hypothetical protein